MTENNGNKSDTRPRFENEDVRELALAYLSRAQHAGSTIRGLLFTLSSAAIGYAALQMQSAPSWLHIIAICLFAVAIGLNVWAWDLQKSKSIRRFDRLRDDGYAEYVLYEKSIRETRLLRNDFWDLISYVFIFGGFLAELVVLLGPLC